MLTRRLQSIEAESAMLGGCLLRPSLIDRYPDIAPEHFVAHPQHRTLWAAMLDLHREGTTIDAVVVLAEHSRRHGPFEGATAYLATITDETPIEANIEAYADILRQRLRARDVVAIAQRLESSGDAASAIHDLEAATTTLERWSHTPADIARTARDVLVNPIPPGVSTGFPKWDSIGGLRPGELTVLAARPAHGKTALALNVAARTDANVLVFSGEQDIRAVVMRLLSSQSKVPLQRIRVTGATDADLATLGPVVQWLQNSRIHIIDKPAPRLADIERDTRLRAARDGVQLVIVDYLQRMKSDSRASKWEAVTDNVLGLKELARTHNVAVLCLAQAARTCDERTGQDRCPTLSDLQHASAIEQEADVVLGLYRPMAYDANCGDPSAILTVLKNRQGPTGAIRLTYSGETVTFEPTLNMPYRVA